MNLPGADLGPDTVPLVAGEGACGAYVLDGCIHAGRTADLYRVHVADGHAEPGFPLVMKLAHAGAGEGGAGFVHSEVENQVLPLLGGPHVPRFVASLDMARAPRLVMEWVEGRSLQDWLDAPQRPANDEVLRLGLALARAVHSLHRQHLVHQDLQPAHVLFRADGSAVLLGFGQACHAQLPDLLACSAPARDAVTRAWLRASAAWVAPEPLLGIRGDARSDVYAIGVMLYQLLAGALPFGAPQSVFGLHRRLWQVPPPLQQSNPSVTPWLQEVVRRCLAPEAAQRYPTAAHLVFDLLHPQPVRPAPTGLAGLQRQIRARGRGWLRALRLLDEPVPASGTDGWPAPIVMLVVTPSLLGEPPPERLRLALRRALGTHMYARLLCVMALAPDPEGTPVDLDDSDAPAVEPDVPRDIAQALAFAPGEEAPGDLPDTVPEVAAPVGVGGAHRRWLARLRLWARPLGQPGREPACRVLGDTDVVQALLACAAEHFADEIVLPRPQPGAAPDQAQGMKRDTAAEMTAERVTQLALAAPCTVQLVGT